MRDKVDIKLSDETAAELAKRPIEYDTGYTLLPGNYTIKMLARDDETGRIGTYMSKFVIPNLNKEDEAHPDQLRGAEQPARGPARRPLHARARTRNRPPTRWSQDGQKLIPSVTRVFSRSRDMYVYLQAYEPAARGRPAAGGVRDLLPRPDQGVRNPAAAGHRRR